LDETFTSGLTDYLAGLSTMVSTVPDEDTAAVLATFEAAVKEFGDVVIASVPSEICHDGYFFTGTTPPGCGRTTDTVGHGSGVCNLVAKSFLDQTPSSDVSIVNIGSCRSGIDSGDFTVEKAITLLPFSNTLVEIQMTGEDIIEVLNSAAKNALSKTSPGAFPYASGLRYDVDANNMEAPM
jgi:5'-nucleotidase/UDP-sugar diphosphatase